VSVFTLTQLEYLIHKSILQIVFATNCLSPCKECLFATNISSEISSKCKSCSTGSLLYNNTCLIVCPDKTFQSSVKDSDNITSIGICLDCPSQCASCSDNTSCTDCNSSSAFKYQIYNLTTNSTDCLSSCPINGFYENAVAGNETQNVTEYQCATCKTNCSVCSGATDCYKCAGFLVLSKNLCIDACPSGTVQSVQNILFKNTTVSNVSVCVECSVHLNDSSCLYCNSSECLACSTNFTLDYLASKKCLSQCTEGFYTVGDKVLASENYTYAVCEKCSVECKTCKDVATNCLTCKWVDSVVAGQYYQLGNTCYLAGTCPSGYFADQVSKTCQNCSLIIAGCLICSSNKFCTDCN
jgi:proprotein convertase subtilisin/kexin type 5